MQQRTGDARGEKRKLYALVDSWTGNLVTNTNAAHLWLDEGFTVFAERRVVEALEGEERRTPPPATSGSSRPSRCSDTNVAAATPWLAAHFAAPLRVEALAQRVGMSVSSLHAHFKAVTASHRSNTRSSFARTKSVRLIHVDKLDVASASLRVGYQSPSQLMREHAHVRSAPRGATPALVPADVNGSRPAV